MPKTMRFNDNDFCHTADELLESLPTSRVLALYNAENNTNHTPEELGTDYELACQVDKFFEKLQVSGKVKVLDQINHLRKAALEQVRDIDLERVVPLGEANERLETAAGFDLVNEVMLLDHFYSGNEDKEERIEEWPDYMPSLTEGQLQALEVAIADGAIDHLFLYSGNLDKSSEMELSLRSGKVNRRKVPQVILQSCRSFSKQQLEDLAFWAESYPGLDYTDRMAKEYKLSQRQTVPSPQWLGFKGGRGGYEVETENPLTMLEQYSWQGDKPALLTLGSYMELTAYLHFLEKKYRIDDLHKVFLTFTPVAGDLRDQAYQPSVPLWTPLNHVTASGKMLVVQGDRRGKMQLDLISGADSRKTLRLFAQRKIIVL